MNNSKSDNDYIEENNIYAKKIDIILLLLNNNNIENIVKKRSQTENNILKAETIKDIIHKTLHDLYSEAISVCKNEYLIKYILNFSMNADIEELKHLIENTNSTTTNSTNSTNIFNLDIIKDINELRDIDLNSINNSDNNKFTDTDAIIIILSKKEKIYYIKKTKTKNKITKKNKKTQIKTKNNK
jgi:hypothetical protein